MGPSHGLKPQKQFDRVENAWRAEGDGKSSPLTLRIVGKGKDERGS